MTLAGLWQPGVMRLICAAGVASTYVMQRATCSPCKRLLPPCLLPLQLAGPNEDSHSPYIVCISATYHHSLSFPLSFDMLDTPARESCSRTVMLRFPPSQSFQNSQGQSDYGDPPPPVERIGRAEIYVRTYTCHHPCCPCPFMFLITICCFCCCCLLALPYLCMWQPLLWVIFSCMHVMTAALMIW